MNPSHEKIIRIIIDKLKWVIKSESYYLTHMVWIIPVKYWISAEWSPIEIKNFSGEGARERNNNQKVENSRSYNGSDANIRFFCCRSQWGKEFWSWGSSCHKSGTSDIFRKIQFLSKGFHSDAARRYISKRDWRDYEPIRERLKRIDLKTSLRNSFKGWYKEIVTNNCDGDKEPNCAKNTQKYH